CRAYLAGARRRADLSIRAEHRQVLSHLHRNAGAGYRARCRATAALRFRQAVRIGQQFCRDLNLPAAKFVYIPSGAFGADMDVASATTPPKPPWFGALLYHVLPYRRRVILQNLRRAFGDRLPETQIRRLAQANYAHYARFFLDSVRLQFAS